MQYLVYNTRKRQEGGDSAERYFSCTEQGTLLAVVDAQLTTLRVPQALSHVYLLHITAGSFFFDFLYV